MATQLQGKRVAILATDGYEQSELFEPKKALEQAGAETVVVSLKKGEIKGWNEKNWGDSIKVDMTLEEANPQEFDALLLPGGVMNPDKLRENEKAVAFAQHFVDEAKPIAAICHGPQLLIETGALSGRKLTSYPSLKTDIINAGGDWHDAEVLTDNGLVTSRKPSDIPAFNKKMIEEIAEGQHDRPRTSSRASEQQARH